MAINPFTYNYPTPAGNNKFNFQPAKRTPNDIVKLGNFTIPGISKVEVSRKRKVVIQKKKDGKGDRSVDSGAYLARVKITVHLFTDDDYNEMERILDYIEVAYASGTSTKEVPSFSIDNPDTRVRNVFDVVVESIDGPFHMMPAAYTEYSINCIETVKQKKQSPKTQKEATQKPVQITTPVAPDFQKNLPPSQDSSVTNPKRTK